MEDNYINFASSLMATIRKFGLYPARHPALVSGVEDLLSTLQEILNIKNTISISLSADNQLLIEDYSLGQRATGLVKTLSAYFKKLGIENIIFNLGVTDKDMEAFIQILLIDPEEMKNLGDLHQLFLDKGIQNIKIAQFSYVKVQYKDKDKQVEGKTVAFLDEAEKYLLDKLKTQIKDFSKGKIKDPEEIRSLESDIVGKVVTEFKEKKEMTPATRNILKKFLMQSQQKEDVLSRLQDGLLNSGCPQQDVEQLINKIGGAISKKLKVSTQKAGDRKEEFVQVRTENDELKSRISQLQEELDLKTADLERLTKESQTGSQERTGRGDVIPHTAEGSAVVDPQAIAVQKAEAETIRAENEELKTKINQLQKDLGSKVTNLDQVIKESKRAVLEKERIDNIVHHMAEGLVVVDPGGKIVMLNAAAERLLGIGQDSIGVALSETVKDEHLLTMIKGAESEKDGVINKDVELLSPDESTKRILRASSAVVEGYNGKTLGMVTTLNDITQQREMERMKSNFVASVSHELRTPLATIQQDISLLLKGIPGTLTDDQMKFLNMAQGNIKRLKRLINDLLDSAAIEAGKFKLSLSMADINERINNVATFLTRWAETKNISLQKNPLPEKEVLNIDKDRIEQVITNLVSNAIKFTPEGGKISVSATRKEATEQYPQGAIEISISDNGPGIAPEHVQKIFEKFERGNATAGTSGTGLGLSISREIVKLHGGDIWLESKLNEGSKFSFLLPRGKPEEV